MNLIKRIWQFLVHMFVRRTVAQKPVTKTVETAVKPTSWHPTLTPRVNKDADTARLYKPAAEAKRERRRQRNLAIVAAGGMNGVAK